MTAIYHPANRFIKSLWLFIITTLLYTCLCSHASGQAGIPPFRIALTDKTIYSKTNVENGKPVMLVYFDPACDHCQDFTKELTANISRFKNMQIVMITYQSLQMIQQFETDYHLKNYSNIKVGTEGYTLVVQQFYNINRFPFVVLFNKKGSVIGTYAITPAIEELAGKVQQNG